MLGGVAAKWATMPASRQAVACEHRPVDGYDASDPFGWHPEPALIDLRREEARGELTRLGDEAWGLALDYALEEAFRRTVGPDDYPALRSRMFPSGRPEPPPSSPSPIDDVLAEVQTRIVPHLYNSQHPRSFSYFTPPPLPSSIAGELLAQWFHQGVDVFHAGPGAALIEEEVTGWLRRVVGFDEGGWGVLTSGGVMANIMALAVARDRHLTRLIGAPARAGGLDGCRVYVSDQAHFSIGRGLELLGFPPECLVVVESDEAFRLEAGAVAARVRRDRAAGLVPFCIAAVAGSTNTGSVDDVAGLARVARDDDLWLHVDAAYGGAARLSERDAARVPALELADSVTLDPHKWLAQAYDLGALLVRRREDLHATFHRSPEYYRSAGEDAAPLNWLEYSMEGTRRFRALKLWMSWKHLGSLGFARLVEATNDLASELAELIESSDDFEAVPRRPALSVVCFRHLRPGLSAEDLDAHQDALQRALERSGEAWVSTTKLRGRTFLRAGVMNYLSSSEDVAALLEILRRLAESL